MILADRFECVTAEPNPLKETLIQCSVHFSAAGSEFMPAFIGLGGVVVGALLTFGMQAWERHVTRKTNRASLIAEIAILATAIQSSFQTIHMPGAEYKLETDQIDAYAAKAQTDWAEAQAKLIKLDFTSNRHISAASRQLLLSLRTATNYLDPRSRPGLQTDFEHADLRLHQIEYDRETLTVVFRTTSLNRKRTLKEREHDRPE